ncbi:MAG: plasmid pRiA4b ORF-3 family protein [Deltaproteobacteria bacterium]|nr:plasmid pRiA4b ORF-3 family protein [Deltaproteobacteria bacterium]
MSKMFQFKVSLIASDPLIWRRVLVPQTFTFDNLHKVIQQLFQWEESHLHEFGIGDTYPRKKINGRLPLADFFERAKQSCTYTYDFGDNWEHAVVFERWTERPDAPTIPVCIAGEQNAPPEDCGGVPGYYGLLEAIADPAHPEHETFSEWLGGPFDPTQFDMAAINAQLKRIKGKGKRP